MRSRKASFAVLGRLSLVRSTVSAEARTIFVTWSPLSCWRIDLAKQLRLLATQQLAARTALLSCSRDSPLPRGHVDCTVACVHADQHSENPSQQRPPPSASPLAYSPRSQREPTALQPWARAVRDLPPMRTRDSLPPNMAVGASAENKFQGPSKRYPNTARRRRRTRRRRRPLVAWARRSQRRGRRLDARRTASTPPPPRRHRRDPHHTTTQGPRSRSIEARRTPGS